MNIIVIGTNISDKKMVSQLSSMFDAISEFNH